MKLLKTFKYLDIRNVYKETFGGNVPGKVKDKIRPFIEKKTKQLIEECKLAREKLRDIPGTNYQLGLHHMRQGNIDDAILRFKMVIYLTPEKAEAYYNLGKSLIMKGDMEKAEEALQKAVSLKADFPEVKYLMDKIKSPESIDSIPESIIADQIEYRGMIVTDEEKELREQRDRLFVTTMLANIMDKNPNLAVLDLGCAEGGRGNLLRNREVAKKIVGVDICAKTNSIAKNKKFHDEEVYNNIYTAEISGFVASNKEKFDVVIAGNVFSYQGKLDNIFSNIAGALGSGGTFALIINKNDDGSSYKLDVSKDKFIHSIEYFINILQNTGFVIENNKEKDIGDRKYNILITRIP